MRDESYISQLFRLFIHISDPFLMNLILYVRLREKNKNIIFTPTVELKSSQEFGPVFFNCQFEEMCYV